MKPYLILALAAVWAASLLGVGVWQHKTGASDERAVWQTRENQTLSQANAQIRALEEAARKTERDQAQALAAISTRYERKLSDAKTQRAADIAALRTGALRLRDPGAPGLRPDSGLAIHLASAPGQRNDGTARELSGTAAEFLLDLAADADDTARQLAACQQVIRADRQP